MASGEPARVLNWTAQNRVPPDRPSSYDLHCPFDSFGWNTGSQRRIRVRSRGVDVSSSLTAHDEVGGLAEARSAAYEAGITL